VSSDTPGNPPPAGLRGALAQLGAASAAFVRTRVELASVEFAEERDRAQRKMLLAAVAVVAFSFALLAATTYIVVWFWDTQRLAAIAAVAIFYTVIGAVAAWRVAIGRGKEPPPFAATLAELERDRDWLMRRGEGPQ
jgi:uncharacterized membrane protein YqjE